MNQGNVGARSCKCHFHSIGHESLDWEDHEGSMYSVRCAQCACIVHASFGRDSLLVDEWRHYNSLCQIQHGECAWETRRRRKIYDQLQEMIAHVELGVDDSGSCRCQRQLWILNRGRVVMH